MSSIIRENWGFGKWILIASVANWVTVAIYPPLISVYSGLAQAGIFRAMQNLVQPLQQGLIALVILFLPLMSRVLHEKGVHALNQMTKTIVIIGIIISALYTILLTVAGPYLVRIIYPQNEFIGATWLLPYLGLSFVFNVPALFISLSLRALEQSFAVMIMKISAAVTVLTFGTVATALWGLNGIIGSLLISNIIETLASIFLHRKALIRFNRNAHTIEEILIRPYFFSRKYYE